MGEESEVAERRLRCWHEQHGLLAPATSEGGKTRGVYFIYLYLSIYLSLALTSSAPASQGQRLFILGNESFPKIRPSGDRDAVLMQSRTAFPVVPSLAGTTEERRDMNASSTRASVPGLFPPSQEQPRNSNNAAFEVDAYELESRRVDGPPRT